MTQAFNDHFSGHAEAYARHRPRYPLELFQWLADAAAGKSLAWDCATGNGQAAVALAGPFERVIATDASAAQIANAEPHAGVEYRVEPAECSTLHTGSIDLVFVSQAMHWFDLERFYAEVRRVLRPGGLLAALTYVQLQVDEAVDTVVADFYQGPIHPYWPPERRHVEQAYASLPFPFNRIQTPAFVMQHEWRLADLLGYLGSWSAVQRYRAATGHDPIEELSVRLAAAWGDPESARRVVWPLVVLAGY